MQITAELEEKFQSQIQNQVQMQVRSILEAMGHTPPAPNNTPQPRQVCRSISTFRDLKLYVYYIY